MQTPVNLNKVLGDFHEGQMIKVRDDIRDDSGNKPFADFHKGFQHSATQIHLAATGAGPAHAPGHAPHN